MSIELRPFDSLGRFENDWLTARHHFSFADYHDPARMGVGVLRVWNDDRIRPGTGFDSHPHRDMEIITYVRQGAITHQDNLGNKGRTVAGDVQVMTAGTGIVHSEHNFEVEDTLIFQIWIHTNANGHPPGWGTRAFPREAGRLVALASGQAGVADALPIHQDATIYGATLPAGGRIEHAFEAGRSGYLVAAAGRLTANGADIGARDGAVLSGEDTLRIEAIEDSEILLADLP